MAQILTMLQCKEYKTENKIVTVPIIKQNKHEEMRSLRGTKEGSEKQASQLWGDSEGACKNVQRVCRVVMLFYYA